MALDDFNPTRTARQITMVILLRNEGHELEGYDPEHDFVPMIDVLRDGWREIIRIRTEAIIYCQWQEWKRRQSE